MSAAPMPLRQDAASPVRDILKSQTSGKEQGVSQISEADARAEGLETVADFLATWDTINSKGKRESAVWVLKFSVKHD